MTEKEKRMTTEDALMQEILYVLQRNKNEAFLKKILTRALILEDVLLNR